MLQSSLVLSVSEMSCPLVVVSTMALASKMAPALHVCAFALPFCRMFVLHLKLCVYYTGQSRTYRRCNCPGHEARQCNNFACFNCDELGHVASACSDSLRCSICKSTGHKANHCPFALIDALNEKQSITTSLVRALESVPPSIASSSSDDQNADHNDDQPDDADTEHFRRR